MKDRAINLVLSKIYAAHEKELRELLIAIILCGSMRHPSIVKSQDIDYLVVLKSIDSASLRLTSLVRDDLEQELQQPMSNTLIDIAELESFDTFILSMDTKAAQALLEATPESILSASSDFTIPTPSDAVITQFSKANFYGLKSLLQKHCIRYSTQNNLDNQKIKMAKIGLIVQKMAIQSKLPRAYIGENEPTLDSKDHRLYAKLQNIKNYPENFDEDYIFQTMFEVLSLELTE